MPNTTVPAAAEGLPIIQPDTSSGTSTLSSMTERHKAAFDAFSEAIYREWAAEKVCFPPNVFAERLVVPLSMGNSYSFSLDERFNERLG